MSRLFHTNLSSLLKEVPTCKFYFYLKPELFAYQKIITELTEDMLLVTVSANNNFFDVLFEYLPKQENRSEKHKKVLEMLKGKYIFHYVHENPQIVPNKSLYNWVLEPDSCTQLTLYQTRDENGLILINPPDETYIDIGFKLSFTIQFDEQTLEVKRIRQQTHYIYNDLPCLGKLPSIIEKNHEIICTTRPDKCIPLNTIIMNGFYTEYQMQMQNKENTKESNRRVILQYKYNALSQGTDSWRNILKDTFRIQQIQVTQNSSSQLKVVKPLN